MSQLPATVEVCFSIRRHVSFTLSCFPPKTQAKGPTSIKSMASLQQRERELINCVLAVRIPVPKWHTHFCLFHWSNQFTWSLLHLLERGCISLSMGGIPRIKIKLFNKLVTQPKYFIFIISHHCTENTGSAQITPLFITKSFIVKS